MGGRVDVGEERGHNCPTQSTMMMITTVALYGSKQSGSSTRLQPVRIEASSWGGRQGPRLT